MKIISLCVMALSAATPFGTVRATAAGEEPGATPTSAETQ